VVQVRFARGPAIGIDQQLEAAGWLGVCEDQGDLATLDLLVPNCPVRYARRYEDAGRFGVILGAKRVVIFSRVTRGFPNCCEQPPLARQLLDEVTLKEDVPMKCWFCDEQARGTCAACGRGLCHQHAHFHDELTLAKSDTSTGFASYYNVYGALKCSDCRLEWRNFQPGL